MGSRGALTGRGTRAPKTTASFTAARREAYAKAQAGPGGVGSLCSLALAGVKRRKAIPAYTLATLSVGRRSCSDEWRKGRPGPEYGGQPSTG